MTKQTSPQPPSFAAGAFWVAAETVLIIAVFYLFAGGAAPDNDEAHYLAKAKHYWNPAWCAGDLFLESGDAHLVFVWLFGWPTLFLPLTAIAWIGRILAWSCLAYAWVRLCRALAPRPMWAFLAAGLFLLLNQHCQLAREWVVGGFEAKCLAYAFVWLALEGVVRNRWNQTWLALGAASMFHVLVGGWSAVACMSVWLLSDKTRPTVWSQAPALAGGLLLALPGLVPAIGLTLGVDREVVAEANQVYVFERLSHHLAPHTFEARRYAVFAVLSLAWLVLAFLLRQDEKQRRLQGFVLAALVIAGIGLTLDLALLSQPKWSAAVLRYYWFRLADAALPLGVSLAVLSGIDRLNATRPVAAQWLSILVLVLACVNLAFAIDARRIDPRPGADIQSLSNRGPLPEQDSMQILADWQRTCAWIAAHTPPDAVFLTPRRQQTFKWYAGRAEVFCWKDLPQDARAIVEWRARRERIFPTSPAPEGADADLLRHTDEELASICRDYGARYFIVDRTKAKRRPRFMRVYAAPEPWEDRPPTYEVYDATLPIR